MVTMADSSGNGHDGTYVGVTPGATGIVVGDTATRFGSGTTAVGYSQMPLDFSTGFQGTCVIWVQPDSGWTTTGGTQTLFHFKDTGGLVVELLLVPTPGSYQVQFVYPGTTITSSPITDDGAAHQIVIQMFPDE